MILNPKQHQAEWKLLLPQMLDFMHFKEVMQPRHHEEIKKISNKRTELDETHARLEEEKRQLAQLEEIKNTNREIVAE